LKSGPVIACPNKECEYERPNENPTAQPTGASDPAEA
jgi:hypothetical protein